ncbi:MAG: hypothetical protein ACI3V0_05035 [Faecousia sp.]
MPDFEKTIPQAKKLAQSPEGQQLAALLQQLGGSNLQQAMERAAKGDFSQAQQVISTLMENPQARQLLEKLGGTNGK